MPVINERAASSIGLFSALGFNLDTIGFTVIINLPRYIENGTEKMEMVSYLSSHGTETTITCRVVKIMFKFVGFQSLL